MTDHEGVLRASTGASATGWLSTCSTANGSGVVPGDGTTRTTQADHKSLADADPPGYSAAQCVIA